MTRAEKDLLFQRMSCDIGVMSEWADDENALREEIETADDEIILTYWETFCK